MWIVSVCSFKLFKERRKINKFQIQRKIKQFAISLHFYSPKAYQFVRKSLHLPNPANIRSWAMSIDCEPGFLQQVIDHLQLNMKDDKKDCVLLVDEMSIKKEVLWDAKLKKFTGNVDYGPNLAEEQDTN